jgi:hypothetical protein
LEILQSSAPPLPPSFRAVPTLAEATPSSTKLTLLQAKILTAMLAGFWARAGDGHPGAQMLAEGLRVLQALIWCKEQCVTQAQRERKRRGPTQRDSPRLRMSQLSNYARRARMFSAAFFG